MGWGEVASAELHSRTVDKHRSRKAGCKPAIAGSAVETGERLIKRHAMMLDMGEGSREQGFRLNGCR